MTTDPRIHDLAKHALALSQGDIVVAVEILRETAGLGHDAAFAAIDALLPDDEERKMKTYLKIYLATSWRNELHPVLVRVLRGAGHEVYDFRECNDFRWPSSTLRGYVHALENNPIVAAAYQRDKEALDWCDVVLLVMPCGRSAHLEAMYASGKGKHVIVLFDESDPWELMYRLFLAGTGGAQFVTDIAGLREALKHAVVEPPRAAVQIPPAWME
jgi:hypothetical protein